MVGCLSQSTTFVGFTCIINRATFVICNPGIEQASKLQANKQEMAHVKDLPCLGVLFVIGLSMLVSGFARDIPTSSLIGQLVSLN